MAGAETIGLVVLGLGVPSTIMSCYLPSPSTAYDKASGKISSGPASLAILRRGEIIGAGVSIAIGGAVALIASKDLGPAAAGLFAGCVGLLGLFCWEYERAFRLGRAHAAESGGDVP